MTVNAQLGYDKLPAGASQPEVPVNAADDAIVKALAGQVTINFTSNANLTLTATNPAAPGDNWGYKVIRLTDTGTVLTAARDVVYPDVDTLYGGPSRMEHIIDNATARTLTIKRSGQTGVAVTAGTRAKVYHSGTDIKAITNPLP